jgi:hypothetical protein
MVMIGVINGQAWNKANHPIHIIEYVLFNIWFVQTYWLGFLTMVKLYLDI